jgi:hypothetical protein
MVSIRLCLSRIPDPDFYPSRIPDPKTATKERGEENFFVIPFSDEQHLGYWLLNHYIPIVVFFWPISYLRVHPSVPPSPPPLTMSVPTPISSFNSLYLYTSWWKWEDPDPDSLVRGSVADPWHFGVDPDPYPGSGSCYFRHWPSICQQKLMFNTSVADPGCLSRIPDPAFYPFWIPDLGSRIQKQQQKREVKKNLMSYFFM